MHYFLFLRIQKEELLEIKSYFRKKIENNDRNIKQIRFTIF